MEKGFPAEKIGFMPRYDFYDSIGETVKGYERTLEKVRDEKAV